MFTLQDEHIDVILAVVFSIMIFLVGLAWNSLVDTIIRVYGNADSVELALLYAFLITVIAFIVGDYIINKFNITPFDEDHYMHKFIKWVGKPKSQDSTIETVR
jgi:hypothetical protein